MLGGTTSGYSLIGSRHMAINPTRKTTLESTPAKIGRRMKKWEKFMFVPLRGLPFRELRGLVTCHCVLGRHGHTGTSALQAVDNNPIICLQAGTNDALALDERTELDWPVL